MIRVNLNMRLMVIVVVSVFIAIGIVLWLNFSIFTKVDFLDSNINETKIKVFISNYEVTASGVTTVYSASMMPEFRFETKENIKGIFLDEFLNIVDDKFYGSYIVDGSNTFFTPNFIITPKTHSLRVHVADREYKFIFTLAYHETFEEKLSGNSHWRMVNNTTSSWFRVEDSKLKILPRGDANYASLYYNNQGVKGDITLDISIMPMGEIMAFVPYLIDGKEYKFALGTDS